MRDLMSKYRSCNIKVISGYYLDDFQNIYYKDECIEINTRLFINEKIENINKYMVEYSIGALIEPREMIPNTYKKIVDSKLYKNFYRIFTHHKYLLEIDPVFTYFPTVGCWIDEEDRRIYNKTKLISIIASDKRQTYGHKLRHSVIEKFSPYLDGVFGYGYNPVKNKIESLKDFRYSITIENAKEDYYFSEKLIDCFATATVPIYWGCPSIEKFFDINGIIMFEDLHDLYYKIAKITQDDYNNRIDAIKNNFSEVSNYDSRKF